MRLAAVAAAVALAIAPSARSETLSDALASAYNNSQLLEQNRALLRAADEGVPTALANLRPVISYLAQSIRTQQQGFVNIQSTLGITAQITLFTFGKNRLAVEAAKESVLNVREQLRNVEQTVLLTAVQAYVAVVRAQEFVSLRENNVRLISEELKAAQDRFDLGEVTVTDVSIAEASLASAKADLASARGDLQIAREQYVAAIGRAPGKLVRTPAAPATAKSLEEAKSIARRLHPTILAVQHQVKAGELNIRIAQAAMLPSLTGQITGQVDQNGNDLSQLTVKLSGPIYQGGGLSSAYRTAVANRDASRAQLLQQAITVVQNVGTAWAQRNVARATYGASADQIKSARVAYRGVREEATLGARTTLDVLTAEQDLLNAQANRISAYANYYVATYQLLSSMGLLTADHLKLNVIQYDPEAYYNAVRNGPITRVSPQGKRLDLVLQSLGKK